MSTFISGIASCSALDTAGEVVDIKGLDITSLSRTGTINWEHRADTPAQTVGKILTAKKIFSELDCSNDNELHFWNKVKLPLVYIVAELLDDYTASAKECAGQFKYSRDNPDKVGILGFSVEGSEIPGTRNQKMIIMRSIARKVTLTCSPANKACVAEIFENQRPQIRDEFEEIFKSEANAIEMFKSDEGIKIYDRYLAKKEAEPPSQGGKPPKSPYNEYENKGIRIGTTKSGKHVFSHGHVGDYDFNPAEHKEAGEHHRRAAVTADNPKLADNHIQRMTMHNNAALSGGRQENRAALSLKQKDKVAMEQNKQQVAKSYKMCKKHASLKKDMMGASTIPNMSAPPPEPNQASASAMQSGATQSGWQPQQWAANIKEGLGLNKSWSPGKVSGDSVHYSHPQHDIVSIQKQPSGEFHVKHQGKLAGIGGIKGIFPSSKEAGAHAKKYMAGLSQGKIIGPKTHNVASGANAVIKSDLKKALEAGSTNAAPSTLTNGAAYQTESLSSSQADMGEHNFKGTKKKDWNRQSKEDYQNWPEREKFEKFMSARMPHLKLGEIQAIGRVLALKKSVEGERSLRNLVSMDKALKFGTAEDQTAVAAALEERKKNPPKKQETKKKSPALKSKIESEVSHVSPYDSEGKYEIVHLKSGHELHGHPAGKFKAGDKVVGAPHLMGTHILEHKK